ncbi:uncharacterized protein (TIGR02231 family) [Comamonas odontotermitis]|uniref:Uncharacterized protein (TIGR02231 family) n=1 Tax=Comamonas odontotermitis TaxID=379895 RepID=A0ABR6RBZ7_9BURK|nr:DUF4139 domain-containing protein [Comamonas odontotermitis]MBB6576659.1 uncharacterized protein (TIGR02231 family) [Comamonas odontotermitis]
MQRKPRQFMQFIHPTPITLATALAAGCASALAADVGTQVLAGAQAPISQVVLYPGVAAVERTARINAGTRQLTFECLPAAIDVASLQVSADAQVRIGDYKTLLQPRDVAGKSCASPLDTQIRALEDQLAAINADSGASTLVASYLQGLTQPGSEGNKPTPPSQIGATSDALRTTSRDNALRAHQLLRQKELIEEQLKPLRLERDRTGAQRAQVMRVTVQLATNADATVRLNYQVRGPSWQPSYRAQLDTAKNQVQLERQALVVQASGEDWSNVQLTLSTGQPGRNTQARLPRPWTLDVRQQRVYEVAAAPAAAPAPAPSSVTLFGSVDAKSSAPLPELDVSSINTAYSTQFVVPYKITVPASSERITLSLGSVNQPVSLITRSTPAVEEAAYLVATLAAPPGVWPAGPVALFRDTAFVGNGQLDFGNATALARGLSFGRDDRISVRELPSEQDTGSGGFLASKTARKVLHRYAITNRHDRAVQLQVLEAAPVSRNDKITVASTYRPEPRSPRWQDQAGMVEWWQPLAAGDTAEFSAQHDIRYPQDVSIQEDR